MRLLILSAIVITLMAPQEPQQVFRTGVEVVRLDVTVLDDQRRPVTGLTADDFILLEDGQPRPIVAFDEISVPVTTIEPGEATWVTRTASDVPSNHLPDGRLLVIVMDDATAPHDPKVVQSAKDIARGAIDRMGPHDLAAVVFTMDNRHAQNFTTDRARLAAAADRFKPGFYMGGRLGFPTEADKSLEAMSMRTLQSAAGYLATVPNRRKAVIYVSTGIPISEDEVAYEIANLDRALDASQAGRAAARRLLGAFDIALRANVQIYPVDPAGLGGWQFHHENQLRMANRLSPSALDSIHLMARKNRDYLQTLAHHTGGRATLDTNEFDTGLDRIFVETSRYYFLGYEPAAGDSRYRRLQIRVKRPGLTVLAREGHFRLPAEGRAEAADPSQVALSHLLPRADIPMHLALAPFGTARREAAVAVTIGVDLREALAGASGAETLVLQAQAFTVEGRPLASSRQEMRIPASWQGVARQDALAVLNLPPGQYEVRASAVAEGSGRAGSVYGYVEVADFSRAPLALSGVLLASPDVRQALPASALEGIAPVVPTTTRAFAPGDRVGAFVRLFQGGRSALQPVTVRTRVENGRGEAVSTGERTVEPDAFDARTRAADQQFMLPLAGLAPGAYLLVIEAAAGREPIVRQVRFEVR
jgi:VWFA-related protein